MAEVDEVDEDGAGRGGVGVRQETVVGVYVDGLRGCGILGWASVLRNKHC